MQLQSKITRGLLMTLALMTTIPALARQSETLRDQFVEATLVGKFEHIQPGTPYRLGLLLSHDPGWHTYWKSTATGYATSIEWDLPKGFKVSEIHWPTPKIYDFQGFTDYVYEGEVLLMVTLTPPATLSIDEATIGFSAEWLMCEAVCVPGSVSSSLTLPVMEGEVRPTQWAPLFNEASQDLPASPENYSLQAFADGKAVILELKGLLPEAVTFFDAQAVFEATPETRFSKSGADTLEVMLPLDAAANEIPDRLIGVLKAKAGWPGAEGRPSLSIDVPISPSATGQTAAATTGITFGILGLAFVGGLILNLMPCVFPVLGIKIMGFVGQAGSSKGKIAAHGLIFTAGVVLSFWALAGLLLILRSGGNQLGWGFQLQSPGFVLALTLLLFAFALNMSGLFEFGQSAVGVGSELTAKSGFTGSFFSGVLATVVATPCAAPFLAPALGAALTLPAASSFLVFTVIALGLSLPYLALSVFPGLLKFLPRPGAWMETFKQFMSFLLYATVGFLIWVLAGQLSEEAGYPVFSLLKVLLSLVILAFALWAFGRWGAFHRAKRTRLIATIVSVSILIGSLMLGFSGTRAMETGGLSVDWEKWEPGKAESLAESGKIVYVDFTARWCVTCQTNKAAVFSSSKVLERFSELEVVTLKADWTNQDPAISEALAKYGRSAVPFNLIHGPGSNEPVILPELLTPGIVLDAVERASKF